MAKVWVDKGNGIFEATDTVVLENTTRGSLVLRKSHLQTTISGIQAEIDNIDADITAIDAL